MECTALGMRWDAENGIQMQVGAAPDDGVRHWDSEPRRDGGEYPTAGAGTVSRGPRSACWDAGPDSDGLAAALLELAIASPVATPVPG